jgi:valyl-tRNA synthetase
VNELLENYRFDEAANAIYQFFWGSFCDWYLEIVKLRLDFSENSNKAATIASLTTLLQVFEASLRLLSPFMPFITEEIWHAVYDGNPPAKSIALARYPFEDLSMIDAPAVSAMVLVQRLVVETRGLRKEIGVEEKAVVPIEVRSSAGLKKIAEENAVIIQRLARVSEVRFVDAVSAGLPKHSTPDFDTGVIYERTIDVPAERERLTKEAAKLEKNIAAADGQLNNPGFLAKAPAHIVDGLKKQREENRRLLDKIRGDHDALPGD